MATQQIGKARVGGRWMRRGGVTVAGLALALLVVMTLAALRSEPVRSTVSAVAQPVIGRNITTSGLVFDGLRYRSMPISNGAPRARSGYIVTGQVWEGGIYRTAPVQVGGR
jgi:hypothetical protein